MNPVELKNLGPYFREGERYLNGQAIDWSTISYETMHWLTQVREHLDAPVMLIRGAHPHQPTAVDWCCPGVPLAQVFLALTRVPRCSWGVYSGGSAHLDTRPCVALPARWMAVKIQEEELLKECGLAELETARKDGWIYLAYNHAKALDALVLVCRLAEGKRTAPAAV